MWYIFAGVSGVSLGIGMMIWALKERSNKFLAIRAADKAARYRKNAEEVARTNVARAKALEKQLSRNELQLTALRSRLNETRIRLAQCGDPKTIKSWLDHELGKDGLL